MSLVSVGTVAFDAIETPYGKTDKIIGGACTYISLAASFFRNESKIISVVGDDFPQEMLDMFASKNINDEEARLLTSEHSLVKAAKQILTMGPSTLIIKKGEHGALLFQEDKIFHAPALPLEQVFDPTGAGDTFAGGFIGYIAAKKDQSWETMKKAIIVGSALASFTVEKFGIDRLREINIEDVKSRINAFSNLSSFSFSNEDFNF